VFEKIGHLFLEIAFHHHDFSDPLAAAADGDHAFIKGAGDFVTHFAVAPGGEYAAVIPSGQAVQFWRQPECYRFQPKGVGFFLHTGHEAFQLFTV
jgi:hypothetical protein